ncbi:MAG: hypothetical protein AB7O97_24085 [Planctomycetota bacterium]
MTFFLYFAIWCATSAVLAVLLGRAIAGNRAELRPTEPALLPLPALSARRRRRA